MTFDPDERGAFVETSRAALAETLSAASLGSRRKIRFLCPAI